ncbi:hypothetical protein [Streptomyces lutosisoli]|uniref:Uncharacterized protein n=1 Tax=Streptomyces lutosisoli TaxID=2665721 RepID=A0ABW2VYU7_9ACTN
MAKSGSLLLPPLPSVEPRRGRCSREGVTPNFKTLAELASWHEQQADPLARPQRRVAVLLEHQESAVLLRRMIGNRALVDPNRLTLAGPLPLEAPGLWCERHGYRCISSRGAVGVIAQRGSELPVAATLGDTLVWDGKQITVKDAGRPA